MEVLAKPGEKLDATQGLETRSKVILCLSHKMSALPSVLEWMRLTTNIRTETILICFTETILICFRTMKPPFLWTEYLESIHCHTFGVVS